MGSAERFNNGEEYDDALNETRPSNDVEYGNYKKSESCIDMCAKLTIMISDLVCLIHVMRGFGCVRRFRDCVCSSFVSLPLSIWNRVLPFHNSAFCKVSFMLISNDIS